MTTVDINTGSVASTQTIKIRVRSTGVDSFRGFLAASIMKAAALVAPCQLELIEDEPPIRYHDVHVDKVGGEMRLSIGDRAVRLDRSNAGHIGDLLTLNGVGGIRKARADEPVGQFISSFV